MESEGGGVAAATAIAPGRLTSQHSTLRETFLATDLADSLNDIAIVTNENNNNNNNSLNNPRPVSNLTLGAVLNSTKKSPPPNNVVVRTLLEIIRNDETLIGGSSTSSSFASRKSWKSFKDRLKLKRGSNQNQNQNQNPNSHQWATIQPVPQSDVLPSRAGALNARSNSLQIVDEPLLREGNVVDESMRNRGSFRLSAALAAEREETLQRSPREMPEVNEGEQRENNQNIGSVNNNGNNEEEEEEEREEQQSLGTQASQPVRMSLMDLLEDGEQQSSVRGPIYTFDNDDEKPKEKAEEEPEEEEEETGKEVHSCCVCMVRHKGAAFIPCGHTFCRKCSRELWVQRGNCPLCNNYILEILDIF